MTVESLPKMAQNAKTLQPLPPSTEGPMMPLTECVVTYTYIAVLDHVQGFSVLANCRVAPSQAESQLPAHKQQCNFHSTPLSTTMM